MRGAVRILVPLDGSKLAEYSLAYIGALKPLGLSHVEIVSVVEPEIAPERRGQEDEDRERNLLASYHRELAEEIRVHTAIEVETTVPSGPAVAAILQEADIFNPDYLIIATHGASGISRWRFGSVADKVIRGARCATLVVGPRAAEREEWLTSRLMPVFKAILVPLDGSELAEKALPVAKDFAEAFGAKLHLVGAVSQGAAGNEPAWPGISPEDLTRETREYLNKVRGLPGLGAATLAAPIGPAAQVLTDYVTDNGIDLIIMTSHGRGGILRTALGSTSDRLLGGPAPVLIVR